MQLPGWLMACSKVGVCSVGAAEASEFRSQAMVRQADRRTDCRGPHQHVWQHLDRCPYPACCSMLDLADPSTAFAGSAQ